MTKQFLTLLTLIFLAFSADEPVNKLNGAYRQVKRKYGSMTTWQTRDSVTVVKVFKDGYWMAAFYDDKRPGRLAFDGACGGTYELRNGKYIEKVSFYSWDSTAVGNKFTFDYKVNSKTYEQYGMMNSDKYKNYPINEICERITTREPLKNKSLEGAWFMKEGYWGGAHRFGEGVYKTSEVIKIFSYPMVVYAYYDLATHAFQGAGGAMYQFDGDTLTETNEFWSWQKDGKRKGFVGKHKISLENGQLIQQGWEGKLREVFAKAR